MFRDIYLFVFDSMQKAEYWFRETARKFSDDIYAKDCQSLKLSFPEADYYFVNEHLANRYKYMPKAHTYKGDAIYIILDDIERRRLGSYNDYNSMPKKQLDKIFTPEEQAVREALKHLIEDVNDLTISISLDPDDQGAVMYRQAIDDVRKLIRTDLQRLGTAKEE